MENSAWLQALSLTADTLSLEPMLSSHADALVSAASDGELWNLWYTGVPNRENVDSYIEFALHQQQLGLSLPFVVIDKLSGDVIGSTRICNADSNNQRLEIGYTWYSKRFQRSYVNTQCKLLLLSHAFEQLSAIAVEFRTHWHNQQSRNAIARLGAKQDGILRNHAQTSEGVYRDTVVFSIINHEWPVVKQSLQHKLLR